MKAKFLFSLFAILTSFWLSASPVDTYQFKDEVTKERYQALVKELRCPKCQNQNLADSNSQIAVDLRAQVYDMLNQGRADSEIMHYMVERYGDFVLYRPQVSKLTYILWFGPIVLIMIGAMVLFFIVRKKPNKPEDEQLSAEQAQKLQQFLKDK
ncbi:MAG: cytochrome c-type biogenesis protein [Thalassotalea sp.]